VTFGDGFVIESCTFNGAHPCVKFVVNKGVEGVFIKTSNVVGVAHCPLPGVKVYVLVPMVFVLIVAGFHDPEMELVLVAGKLGGAMF
jgi:hypothetical protein